MKKRKEKRRSPRTSHLPGTGKKGQQGQKRDIQMPETANAREQPKFKRSCTETKGRPWNPITVQVRGRPDDIKGEGGGNGHLWVKKKMIGNGRVRQKI